MAQMKPATTGSSRLFVAEGGSSPLNTPEYQGYAVLGGVSLSAGGVDPVYKPSELYYDEFDIDDVTRGNRELIESSMSGLFPRKSAWDLLDWADRRCKVAIHAHFGKCGDPKSTTEYDKKMIFEPGYITSVDLDDVGSLDENSVITGSADFSAVKWYEVRNIKFYARAQNLISADVPTIVFSSPPGYCRDCGNDNPILFALTPGATASPSTPPDILYSLNMGATWFSHDIDSAAGGSSPQGGCVVGGYVVVIISNSQEIHYAPLSEFDGRSDPTFVSSSANLQDSTAGIASDENGNVAYISGSTGYIYKLTDPAQGVTAVEAQSIQVGSYGKVHINSRGTVLVAGVNGILALSLDGENFQSIPAPFGVGTATYASVFAKSEDEIWVCNPSNSPGVKYTLNRGKSWTDVTLPFRQDSVLELPIFAGFATDSVIYVAVNNVVDNNGTVLRSSFGGASGTWEIVNEVGQDPESFAIIPNNPNFTFMGARQEGGAPAIFVGT